MDITPISPGDERALRAVWEVETEASRFDLPALPVDPVEETLSDPAVTRSRVRERWLAVKGEEILGAAMLTLPQLDNTGSAEVRVVVRPAVRRKGIGRALFDVAVLRAREEGRNIVIGEVPEPLTDGVATASGSASSPAAAFAAALGAKLALAEMCRVLDLEGLDEERLYALEAEAVSRSEGYELVQWAGPAPEHLLSDLARLTSRLSTDAPLGELEWAEEKWDGERVRESEDRATASGRHWVTTGAVHVASGRMVAYSDIGCSTYLPGPAFQWTTIVEGGHRGHRLGMLIKVANLRLLRREVPSARQVFTWNADSNTHMLAINKALGFRPVATWCEWQLNLS